MKDFIYKYLEGRESEEEGLAILRWLRKKENRSEFNKLKLEWKADLDKDWFPADGTLTWDRIQTQLLRKYHSDSQRSERLLTIFRYAAIFFFLVSLSASAWIYVNKSGFTPETWSTVIADNGQISKLQLPDGTTVWLNSGSKILYSNRYGSPDRTTHLTGEAFFDVAANAENPFVVVTGDLQVKVLGTRFNVSAWEGNGYAEVVLEEGAVELLSKKPSPFSYLMKPGELATFNNTTQKVLVQSVNTFRYTSWKEGVLNLYDLPVTEVVKKLQSRFNQEFDVDKEVESLRYTFTIKNESLSDILQLMEKISPLKATQKGNKIHLQMDKTKKKGSG